jgi:ribosomal protein S18 acetylase RimI-like enzyme
MIELIQVQSGPHLDQIRALFLEYARSLDFSLCFQSFDRELRELPGPYELPDGRLCLCQFDGRPAGCIALKKLEPGICEMKRLYVRPDFRGHQLGLKLSEHLIHEARLAGYSRMRLDTIPATMQQAVNLYRRLGFKEIPPYYDNPLPQAAYMELDLPA